MTAPKTGTREEWLAARFLRTMRSRLNRRVLPPAKRAGRHAQRGLLRADIGQLPSDFPALTWFGWTNARCMLVGAS